MRSEGGLDPVRSEGSVCDGPTGGGDFVSLASPLDSFAKSGGGVIEGETVERGMRREVPMLGRVSWMSSTTGVRSGCISWTEPSRCGALKPCGFEAIVARPGDRGGWIDGRSEGG